MALNPYRSTKRAEAADYGDLIFKGAGKKKWTISFQPNQRGLEVASYQRTSNDFSDIADDLLGAVNSPRQGSVVGVPSSSRHDVATPSVGPILLVSADVDAKILDVFPVNTTSGSRGLFDPKYKNVKSIRFEGLNLFRVEDIEGALRELNGLPMGFVRSPQYGMGIDYELSAITDTLGGLDVDRIVVRSGHRKGLPKVEGRSYILAKVQFDELRRAIRRVHEKALDQAGDEKYRISHNHLLSVVDPVGHPEQPPIYRKDGVTAVIASRSGDSLSEADQRTVIAAARSAAKPAAKRESQALLQLSREIEVVTLEGLIERLKKLIEKKTKENGWQKFFENNPFVLRLAFGFPVVQMQEQFSVGGGKFNKTGEKISDFALKAAATGNLLLVEIKTAETPLFDNDPYRGGVYAPSRHLSGSVNQILDQRLQLQTHLAVLKHSSGIHDVESYAVQGIVIIGRAPNDRDQKKSLELFRHGLKSVLVITFDEMLAKLEDLVGFLRTPDAENSSSSIAANTSNGTAAAAPEAAAIPSTRRRPKGASA
ncbi:Shedu immune nuclease family protein [Azospirillum sp. B2RO_4]|uniref:Shedu immune nuclease family protein n=1 Tax=Azospirillum sp. B2RO_4 TaxID=3027796 RepID=UPI003DA8A2B9